MSDKTSVTRRRADHHWWQWLPWAIRMKRILDESHSFPGDRHVTWIRNPRF